MRPDKFFPRAGPSPSRNPMRTGLLSRRPGAQEVGTISPSSQAQPCLKADNLALRFTEFMSQQPPLCAGAGFQLLRREAHFQGLQEGEERASPEEALGTRMSGRRGLSRGVLADHSFWLRGPL